MKNLKINIGIKNKSSLQKEIDELFKNQSFNIDITSFSKSISSMSKELDKLKSQLKDFGVMGGLKESTAEATKLANQMAKVRENSEIRVKNTSRKEELAQAQAINKALEEQYRLEQQLVNTKSQLQAKLNTASSNSLVDGSVITKFQSELNSISVNTPISKVNELKSAINSLASNDSGIVRLQQQIIKLQERISTVKTNNIDIVNQGEIAEVQQAEREVAKLQTMLGQLKTGNFIDGKKISESINTATNSVRTLENSFKSVNTTASGLSNTMRTMFSYIAGGSGVYLLINNMRKAINTTIDLDSALRDLKRVTDETNSTYSDFMSTANETAIALGTTTVGAIEATTTFSQLGYSFKDASEYMSQMALILSNVGDMSASDSASSLVSILKGFRLEAQETTRVVDVLNEAGNSFALTTQDLTEGLRIGGASLAVANNDLEQSSALIVSGTEILRNSNLVANGLKTISMRLRGVSEDGEELSASMGGFIKEITDVDLTDANGEFRSTYDVLNDIGKVWDTLNSKQQAMLAEEIAGKHRANVFTSIMQNANQLEKAYNTLSESAGSSAKEQQAYIDSLEGRINALKESVVGLTIQMTNSDFLKGFIGNMTSGVNVISTLIDKFGAISPITSVATASLVAFNGKFREMTNSMLQVIPGYGKLTGYIDNYSERIKSNIGDIKSQIVALKSQQESYRASGDSTVGLGKKMIGLNANLVTATATMVACKVASLALNVALSAFGGMLIGTAISGITKLADSLITTKAELNEMEESFTSAFKETSELDTLVQKQKDLQEQLEDTTLSTEEQKIKKEELIGVQKQLAELLPDTATGFDSEGNKISEDTGKIQENIDKKKELLAMESINIAKETNNGDWNNLINNYDKQIGKVKELQKIYNEAPTPVNLENLTEAENKLDGYKDKLNKLSEMMSSWKDVGFSDSDISDMLLGDIYDDSAYEQQEQMRAFQSLKKMVDEYTSSIQENTKAKEDNGNINSKNNPNINQDTSDGQRAVEDLEAKYKSLGYTVSDAKDRIEELNGMSEDDRNAEIVKDTTKAYSDSISEIEKLQGLIKDINEDGELSASTISNIANSYPEIGSAILDTSNTIDFLNEKINEQKNIYSACMESMVADNDNWYANNVANNQNFQDSLNELYDKFTKDGANAYNIDLNNYKNLTELKNAMNGDLIDGLASFLTSLVGGSADTYARDLRNCKSWAEQKAYLISKLDQQIAKAERNLAKHVQNVITISNKTGGLNGESGIDEKLSTMAQAELNKLNTAREEIETAFGGINTAFDRGLSGITSIGGGSSGGNKGGSSGSSTKKDVEDIESLAKRYHDLEDAINDVNNELNLNKILQEGATGKDKIALMEKEIQLYKKQQQAIKNLIAEQKKEAQELKNSLSNQGATFDSDGDISNYNSLLNSKVNWANSLSGDAKESAIEQVKALQEQLDKYDELVNKTIPSQEQEWRALNNTIKDVYKTQAELIADMERNVSETIEYELKKRYDAKKEALNKEKELYNKEYEEANFEEEMNAERNKLAEIQAEIDKVKQDSSRAGQLRLKQLLEEYEAQQKLINDKIKEQQNQAINDRFDEEEALLDKEFEDMTSAENLSKMVADAISTGMIKIGDETINVQNSMNNMLKETEVGFANVALQQSEWLSNLEQIKTLYGSISSIMTNAGLTLPTYDNVSSSRSRSVGDISVTTGNITITGNADSSTLGSIQDMLDAQAKEIYKNIAKQLG